MTRQSRVLDSVAFGEEETAIGTETSTYNVNTFGHILNCNIMLEDNTQVIKGLKGDHTNSRLVDLTAKPMGNITFQPIDLKFFKYAMGDYAETTTYDIPNTSKALPTSLSMKGALNATESVKMLGCYLTNFRMSLTDEDILQVTADIIGLFQEKFTGIVSYTPPSADPLVFCDGVWTFASNGWNLKDISLNYDPKFIQKFGIGSKTAGRKRFPTQIIRGTKEDINFSGTLNIDNVTNELVAAWGGTNSQDVRSDSTITYAFTDDGGDSHTITLSGRVNKVEMPNSDSEEDFKTMPFTGVGLSISISGDL